MSDEIMLVFGEDGVAREYDDTWDITIHCESEEEQKAVLEKLNNSNQEVKKSSDLISRQEAIEHLKKRLYETALNNYTDYPYYEEIADNRVDTWLNELPSVQPERKTGWWLIREGISDAQCSECKMYFRDVYDMDNSDAFCRHCGAKMEGLKVVEDE